MNDASKQVGILRLGSTERGRKWEKPKPKRSASSAVAFTARITPRTLTEEHILAANLGGEYTLGDASCLCCQKIINTQIEQPCLQTMFKEIRYRRGVGSQRLNSRPKTLPLFTPITGKSVPANSPPQIQDWTVSHVNYEDHPSLLALPVYAYPGLLRHVDAETALKQEPKVWLRTESTKKPDIHEDILVQTRFNHAMFCRLIAKTAHCLVVAEFSLDAFEPLLPDLILGKDLSQIFYLVGCMSVPETPASKQYDLGFVKMKGSHFGSYIICTVRIFADLGASTYIAIAGKKN